MRLSNYVLAWAVVVAMMGAAAAAFSPLVTTICMIMAVLLGGGPPLGWFYCRGAAARTSPASTYPKIERCKKQGEAESDLSVSFGKLTRKQSLHLLKHLPRSRPHNTFQFE